MPVTQRFVHGGLCLVAAVLSLCVVVLVLGASRSTVNNAGLPGSLAPTFSLRDLDGNWYSLRDAGDKVTLLLITPAGAEGLRREAELLRDVSGVYHGDSSVAMAGIQFFPGRGNSLAAHEEFLQASRALLDSCPELRLLNDVDRTVSQAFRVVDETPTFFVIDAGGIIRGRIPLSEGAAVAVTETVASLKAPALPRQPEAPHTR